MAIGPNTCFAEIAASLAKVTTYYTYPELTPKPTATTFSTPLPGKAEVCRKLVKKPGKALMLCLVAKYGLKGAARVAEWLGYYELAREIREMMVGKKPGKSG